MNERNRADRFAEVMATLNVLRPWKPLSESETELYRRLTARVPITLLETAVAKWMLDKDKFPTPHQLLALCEEVRIETFTDLRATRYPPCGKCSADGWIEKEVDGVKRAVKCPCVVAWQIGMLRTGWPKTPLALPPGPDDDVE